MKKVLIILLALSVNLSLFASKSSSVDELFKMANEKYKTGKYTDAVRLYENILKKGIKNGYVYYNLGNAYFKTKELGKAILCYERAKIYLPDDKDVNYNLRYAKLMRVDRFKKESPNPFTVILLFVYNLFSINTLCVLSVIFLFVLSGIFLGRWLWRGNMHLNNILYKLFPYVGGVFLFFVLLLGIKIFVVESYNYAVVLEKEIDVKSGPGKEYTVMFNLHEGTKVNIKKISGNWLFITTPNGFSGWVKKASVEKI